MSGQIEAWFQSPGVFSDAVPRWVNYPPLRELLIYSTVPAFPGTEWSYGDEVPENGPEAISRVFRFSHYSADRAVAFYVRRD